MEDVVLVGFDGSETSARALDCGLFEAQSRGWPVRLVTVVSTAGVDDPQVDHQYLASARRGGEGVLQAALDRAGALGLRAEGHVVAGDPSEVLVDESASAGLAVVGKRGRGGFAGRLLGSVSSGLAAHGACPTVVVPQRWKPGATAAELSQDAAAELPGGPVPWLLPSPREGADRGLHPPDASEKFSYAGQVVVGVDQSGTANPALWAAAEIASRRAVPLRMLSSRAPFYRDSVWLDHAEGAHRFREEVAAELDGPLREVRGRYPDLDASWNFYLARPAEVLVHATRTAQLLVLGTRGHGGFPGLLLGSVSQAVLHHGLCPMMVVPKGVVVSRTP